MLPKKDVLYKWNFRVKIGISKNVAQREQQHGSSLGDGYYVLMCRNNEHNDFEKVLLYLFDNQRVEKASGWKSEVLQLSEKQYVILMMLFMNTQSYMIFNKGDLEYYNIDHLID